MGLADARWTGGAGSRGGAGLRPQAGSARTPGRALEEVNDVGAGLNATVVERTVPVATDDDVGRAIAQAARAERPVCVAGGRHAGGGHQFRLGGVLIDTRAMSRVLHLDLATGMVTAQAGARWCDVAAFVGTMQGGRDACWVLDPLSDTPDATVGGALSANRHGRRLCAPPVAAAVEALRLVDARGAVRRLDRSSDPELFALALGGFGLFGVVTAATLRLRWQSRVEHRSEMLPADAAGAALLAAYAMGATHGDAILSTSASDFLASAVLLTTHPVGRAAATPPTPGSPADDRRVLPPHPHTDAHAALARDARPSEPSTHRTPSDPTTEDFTRAEQDRPQDEAVGADHRGSELVAELCVPPRALAPFLAQARHVLTSRTIPVIDARVRIVGADGASFMPWCRETLACVRLRLGTERFPEAVAWAADTVRRLINHAADAGGSFHLADHRFARADQVESCHPRFSVLLERKLQHDPEERFQSEWYRHYRSVLGPTAR